MTTICYKENILATDCLARCEVKNKEYYINKIHIDYDDCFFNDEKILVTTCSGTLGFYNRFRENIKCNSDIYSKNSKNKNQSSKVFLFTQKHLYIIINDYGLLTTQKIKRKTIFNKSLSFGSGKEIAIKLMDDENMNAVEAVLFTMKEDKCTGLGISFVDLNKKKLELVQLPIILA